jgi:enoyl-CoA hydratase
MMREFKNIILKIENNIAIITLNRPAAFNALCNDLNDDLIEAINIIKKDLNIRVMIITGSQKAFAAGADIKEMMNADMFEAERTSEKAHYINDILESLPIPVIAAVNGAAFGGGCELTLACDFRIAGEKAMFGLPEVSIGVIPGAGGTQRLTKIIGPVRAKEMVMFGRVIKGKEAYDMGLVTKCVADENVLQEALNYAQKLSEKPASALQFAKSAINYAVDNDINTGKRYEKALFSACFSTDDQKEGMKAFTEKRNPEYKNKR